MARKSRTEPIREYLRSEREMIRSKIDEAVNAEDYTQAEYLKGFRNVLTTAIDLCGGEKPKEVVNGT